MAWLDLALLSTTHLKIALTLFGTMALSASLAMPDRPPQPRHVLAHVRNVWQPAK